MSNERKTKWESVNIDKLIPYVNNARTHSKEQINKLRSSLREFGKILQDTYKVIFNINTDITDTDQIRIQDNEYEIIGSISTWNHTLPHKEMIIRKHRQNGDDSL